MYYVYILCASHLIISLILIDGSIRILVCSAKLSCDTDLRLFRNHCHQVDAVIRAYHFETLVFLRVVCRCLQICICVCGGVKAGFMSQMDIMMNKHF